MDVTRYGILAVFVGISSCGGGPEDTVVSPRTPAAEIAPHAPEPETPGADTATPAFEASVADDGETYATWTDHETTIVRSHDRAEIVVSGTPSGLAWSDRYVTWWAEGGFHVVERASLKHLPSPLDGGIVVPKNGAVIVTWTNTQGRDTAVVEVRASIDASPHIRIVAASVAT